MGTLANLLSQVLNTGSQLLVVPVLLAGWGKQLYGEWLALSAAGASLAVLDLGMQNYVVNRLNRCHALGVRHEYARILHSGLLFSLAIANIAAFAVAIGLWLAPLDQWLHFSEIGHAYAAWIGLLLALHVLYAMPHGLLLGIYRTINEYPRGQMITNARFVLALAATLTVVSLGGGPLSVAMVQLVSLLLACVFVVWDLRRRHPEIPLGLRQGEFRLAVSFLVPSSSFLGIQLVLVGVLQGSTLLVNGVFGATMLVTFSTARTLSNLIKQVGATVQNAVWPEFTALEAQQKLLELRRIHLLVSKLVTFSAACSAVYLMVYGDIVLAFWTRGLVAYDATLMAAFMVLALSQSVWLTSSVLLSASNRQKHVFTATLLAGGVGLALGYALSFRFGMTGFVAGIAVADAIFCGLRLPAIACRLIGESRRRYAVEVVLRGLVLFVAAHQGVTLMRAVLPDPGFDLGRLVAGGAVVALIGAASAYLITVNRTERARAHQVVARLLAR